jgi:predicted SAM-dependent methyltransferase
MQIQYLDARKKFPFTSNVFDYVFSEHVIEHLTYHEGINFLQESYRVLKPYGKVRVSTPDLHFLIELYGKKKTELQQRYIMWATQTFSNGIDSCLDTFVINNFFRAWNHKFIYDHKTLKDLMERCGFVDVRRYNPGESQDENLRGIELHGRYISEEFNKLESMVLEGTKPVQYQT